MMSGAGTAGLVMVEQVRSIDWSVRGVASIETAPPMMLHDVKLVLGAILDF
jgi:mRNA-degrading endonuclease toxin of MazEF toxin-antitoxin module